MKKMLALLLALICLSGCAHNSVTAPATQPMPPDKDPLDGDVTWMTAAGPDTEEDLIGYSGGWCVQVTDEAAWQELTAQYGIRVPEGFAPDCANRYVILVLFWDDTTGASFELSQLALQDGMVKIAIHETETDRDLGDAEELIACVVQVDEDPLEIDSFRDDWEQQ